MAKKFIDAAAATKKSAYTKGDGTALTLTNSVRILYDDTLDHNELYVTINRIRDSIIEGIVPDA